MRGQSILCSGIKAAKLKRSCTKQQPKDKSEQVNIKWINSEPYYHTGLHTDPNGATLKGSQPSEIKGKEFEARPTSQALPKDKASHGVVERMRDAEELVHGYEDRYIFDIRPRLIEGQLKDVRPGTFSSPSSTASFVFFWWRDQFWSFVEASQEPSFKKANSKRRGCEQNSSVFSLWLLQVQRVGRRVK